MITVLSKYLQKKTWEAPSIPPPSPTVELYIDLYELNYTYKL